MKLANQFTATAILVAIGRGPCLNNSATRNQGIEPAIKTNIFNNSMYRVHKKVFKRLSQPLITDAYFILQKHLEKCKQLCYSIKQFIFL